jgi:hypothetical protein
MPQPTPTREPVDFYLGRGDNATYLGTTTLTIERVNPDLFRSLTPDEYTETDYLRAVAALTGNTRLRGHALDDNPARLADTLPAWPHEHADSTETPWTYCYDKGTVYVYRYGVEMLQIRCNTHRWTGRDPQTRRREWRPVNAFPAMVAHPQAVAP